MSLIICSGGTGLLFTTYICCCSCGVAFIGQYLWEFLLAFLYGLLHNLTMFGPVSRATTGWADGCEQPYSLQ